MHLGLGIRLGDVGSRQSLLFSLLVAAGATGWFDAKDLT